MVSWAIPWPRLGPHCTKSRSRMVLQTPLPEFCNQTSHPAHSPLGRGARPLPVNKSDCSGKNTAATSCSPWPLAQQATQ